MTEPEEWAPGPAWLFCPADRPDRYGKALSAADVVIVDLEDAVAPAAKEQARQALRGLAESGALDPKRTVVGVNAASTADHALDVALTTELALPRVMLAKAEHVIEVEHLPHEVVVLLETPRGIERAGELASGDNVAAVMWGADDLVAGLGGTGSRDAEGRYRDVARYARARCLIAAKAAGRLALDGVHMDIHDTDGLAAECADAVAVGFDATVAIHPSQLEVIPLDLSAGARQRRLGTPAVGLRRGQPWRHHPRGPNGRRSNLQAGGAATKARRPDSHR